MSDQHSSRWRWLLLTATLVLLGARLVAAWCWVHRSVVPGGGGPPAVLVALNFSHRTIEKWDWKTNRMESIGTFDGGPIAGGWLCTGDGKFVWFDDGILHAVDLEPPHEHRQWKSTLPRHEGSSQVTIVGTSANSRFVALEWARAVYGPTGSSGECHLHVIDLQTGEEVLKRNWGSRTAATHTPGVFRSQTWPQWGATTKNIGEEWRLTDEGAWKLLPRNSISVQPALVEIAGDGAGGYRGLSDEERLSRKVRIEHTEVETLSPDGKHVLRRAGSNRRLFLAHQGRHDVQVLQTRIYHFMTSSFTADGKHVLVGDVFGDVQVFDAETGQLVARTRAAFINLCVVIGLAVAFVGLAISWLFLSFRQSAPLWTIVDLHAAAVVGQIAIFSSLVELRYGVVSQWLMPLFAGVGPVATAALGIAVGWYWIYGQDNFIVKLKWGALSILAMGVVPAVTMAMDGPADHRLIRLVAPPFAGLFAASVMAFMLVPIGMLGWRAGDEPLSFHARRFGLASIMVLIALVSVVLGFLKLVVSSPEGTDHLSVAMALLPTAVLGLCLPAIVIMNASGWLRTSLVIGIVALVAAGMVAKTYQRPGFSPWPADIASYLFAATTALAILGMAMLARKHGWRWRKGQASASEIPSLEAAA